MHQHTDSRRTMDVTVEVPADIVETAESEAAVTGAPVADHVTERFQWSWEGEQ